MTPYTLLIALNSPQDCFAWITFASRFLPPDGQIILRGMVTVREGVSLSEGALAAREHREAFRTIALTHPAIHDDVQVYVDYQPLSRILTETRSAAVDLLLIEWDGPDTPIGGLTFDSVLDARTCDLALISPIAMHAGTHQVLLSLRGGPNLTLGTRVAAALAGTGTVTLFHVRDADNPIPNLGTLLRTVPQVRQTVTVAADVPASIIRQSAVHDIIVIGAALGRTPGETASDILHEISSATDKPLVVVRASQQEAIEFHAPHFESNETLSTQVDRWFAQNTFHSSEFHDLQQLVSLKERQNVRISIALPALNEEATIAEVITTLKRALMDDIPLIDEIVLIDSESSDRTVEIAQSCGIPTHVHQQILVDEVGSYAGKGEALWKSLYVTSGDIIVWVDTDITNIHPRFVYGLVGPLLKFPRLQYVKGYYARPIDVGGALQAFGGGRVTELVARPLLNLFYPELSGILQPLAGEYAGRRSALEQVPFFSGYGVETGLIIDLAERFGLDAIAQVDLETRVHYNQPLLGLSKMSFAILQVFLARLEQRYGVGFLSYANRSMKLVTHEADRFALDITEIGDYERPPMLHVPAYRARFSPADDHPAKRA